MLNDTTHLISDAEVPITSIIFIVMLVLCSYMSSLTSVYLSHCMCRIFNSLRVIIFSGFKKKITTWQWSRLSSKSHTCWGRVLPLSYIVFVYIVYVVHCYIIYIYCIFFSFSTLYILYFLFHSFTTDHLICLCLLLVIKNTAVSIGWQWSLWEPNFSSIKCITSGS